MKRKRKSKSKSKRKCKECRCKPCLCKKQIHCYKITCGKRTKKKKKKSQQGGTIDKRSKRSKRAPRKFKRGRSKQNWETNEGYFGPIMKKNGKLNRDEICRYCYPSDYAKGARKFCKLHHKVWNSKTNSCKRN